MRVTKHITAADGVLTVTIKNLRPGGSVVIRERRLPRRRDGRTRGRKRRAFAIRRPKTVEIEILLDTTSVNRK